MNRLAHEERARILHLLCEGQSIRAITRLTGASKNTVNKLLIDAGRACVAYHDEQVLNLKCQRVQVDEIWSFTYAKQKNVATAKDAPEGAGDTWTWTAIDADSKLIISYLVGGRDAEYAMWFMDDLAARLLHLHPGAHHMTQELKEMLAAIEANRAAMPPEERAKLEAAELVAQRESWIRAMAPCEHGDPDWETCPECLAATFVQPGDER